MFAGVQDHKLDKEDSKLGVREVLKLAVPEEEMAALLSKLQVRTLLALLVQKYKC